MTVKAILLDQSVRWLKRRIFKGAPLIRPLPKPGLIGIGTLQPMNVY